LPIAKRSPKFASHTHKRYHSLHSTNILQYAERVWGIVDGTLDERIDLAIAKTEELFIQTGMKVRLSDHSVGQDVIDTIYTQISCV